MTWPTLYAELRTYLATSRSAPDLAAELRSRSRRSHEDQCHNLWQRWKLSRFHCQLGGADYSAVLRAYYEKALPVVLSSNDKEDGGSDSSRHKPQRPKPRTRLSPYAECAALA